jgi:hypothetical protein
MKGLSRRRRFALHVPNELRNTHDSTLVIALAFHLADNGIVNSFRLWLSNNTQIKIFVITRGKEQVIITLKLYYSESL